MSTYKDLLNKYLSENGFLTEKEFDEVMDSLPGYSLNLDNLEIFIGTEYNKDYIAEEIVLGKLMEYEDEDVYISNFYVNFDEKEIYVEFETENSAVNIPIDEIKELFPKYNVEVEIFNV